MSVDELTWTCIICRAVHPIDHAGIVCCLCMNAGEPHFMACCSCELRMRAEHRHASPVALVTTPAHDHTWSPIPLQMARYVCACGAQGYKKLDGIIRAVKPKSRRKIDRDRLGYVYTQHPASSIGGRLPTLAEQEARLDPRWKR